MSNIWTPDDVAARSVVKLPMEYMQMLAVFGNTSGDINLGLHCSLCKEDVRGGNATADNQWTMECACRTYVGANPLRSH